MTVRCLYFASLKEATGTGNELIQIADQTTVAEFLSHLESLHPELQKHRSRYKVAVQQDMADPDHVLHDGDEVALIPPVSGGSDSVRLMADPIQPQAILDQVLRTDCGAVVLFLGTVRDFAHSQGQPAVNRIDYSAYETMAEKSMTTLVGQVKQNLDLGSVALWHRTGPVAAGQPSVAVAVSSCHRGEAFQATKWLIDQLKAEVPIWKKEIGPSGEVWLEGDARVPSTGAQTLATPAPFSP